MDSDSSDSDVVIITRTDHIKIFCKLYWKALILIITPLIIMPVAFIGENSAYTCFYIFLITVIYVVADILHPTITSLIPITLSTILGSMNKNCLKQMYISNTMLDCLGVMMIIVAIEYCQINKRMAIKFLLTFGYSHYRLSFLLFFGTMFLSTFISNTSACGLMMPLVKAILVELEKMGLLEIYETIGKARQKSNRHEQNIPRPTKFTVFYFLGVSYSASIGGMATVMGSDTNQILKYYCEVIFPYGQSIEFPHFMLLNLPGVLIIGSLMYLWMNFYFLGMFRVQTEASIHVAMSQEESQYIDTLLRTQYEQLGKLKFHEVAVAAIVILSILMQTITNAYTRREDADIEFRRLYTFPLLGHRPLLTMSIDDEGLEHSPPLAPLRTTHVFELLLGHMRVSSRYFPSPFVYLPKSPSKACLNWRMVRDNIHWSVLFITGGSCSIFEALKDCKMTDEFEKFLLMFVKWPSPALAFVVIVFCKIFTEFASSVCVSRCLLPHIAKLSIISRVHPHYLMSAAHLACSLPFHFITGTPANAMVCAYMHIPPWKLMHAGAGPTIISVVVIWFTMTVWSKAVWTDINLYPAWADNNIFTIKT